MPIYSYDHCEQEIDIYQPLTTSEAPKCEKCGEPMEKVFRSSNHVPKSVFPYVTTHISGKPIEVKSEAHLQSLCKQYGVRHRPDAAWIDDQWERNSVREGRGVGSKGCWI